MTNATASRVFQPEGEALRAHPLASFGLDALVAGAARQRPGALAIAAHGEGAPVELSFGDLDRAIGAFLARLRDFDIAPGERAMILAAPGAQAFVALTALLAAGIEPILAPAHLPAERLAQAAATAGAQAIFAPAHFAGRDLEDTLLGVAAQTPAVRLIGVLGAGALDGAADFSHAALCAPDAPVARLNDGWTTGERAMIGALDANGVAHFTSQGALLGAALDLLRASRRGGAAPIVSLIPPGAFAGLAAGPLAALLAGAPLHLLAPFDARALLKILDAVGPARLVAPSAALPVLAQSGLTRDGSLLSLTLIAKGAPHGVAVETDETCRIVEIVASGATLEIVSPLPAVGRAEAA